jgi:hypothetical protein
MPTLPHDQQKAILEGHVGKIDKAMQNVARDVKRMSEILDQDALTKLAAFMHARVNDMIADLSKGKRSVFSLDAPAVETLTILTGTAVLAPGGREAIHSGGSMTVVMPPAPRIPQPQADNDDAELEAVADLLADAPDDSPPPPRRAPAPVTFEMAPAAPDPKKPPPGGWKKPVGRLVGTKEPVWVQTEPPHAAGDEVTEKPDHTGFIKDAGFLDE